MCWFVIDSEAPRRSKYHWGVNSPAGLLISYSNISLITMNSSQWETLLSPPCSLRTTGGLTMRIIEFLVHWLSVVVSFPRVQRWSETRMLSDTCGGVAPMLYMDKQLKTESKSMKLQTAKCNFIEKHNVESCGVILGTSLHWNAERQDFYWKTQISSGFVCLSDFCGPLSLWVSVALTNAWRKETPTLSSTP